MYLFCISCKYIVATIKVPTLVFDVTFLKTTISIISYTASFFMGLPKIRLKGQNNIVNLPYKNHRMVFSCQSR